VMELTQNGKDKSGKSNVNIIISGVGGQGLITLAKVIANACLNANMNVLVSEVHGMAQRGGSVEVHVRIGNVNSPLVPFGMADLVLAMEPVEGLRCAKYMDKSRSTVIINTQPIIPPIVNMGLAKYPSLNEILHELAKIAKEVYFFDASKLAEKIGYPQVVNTIVLGSALKLEKFPFTYEDAIVAISKIFPEKIQEINIKALEIGFNSRLNKVK